MTTCCEFHNLPMGCNQGRDCPERQPAPRSCEALGVCQHPERECVGACEALPTLPGWLPKQAPAAEPPSPRWFGRLLITVWCGVTVGVVYGAVRHFWPQIDDQLLRLYWSASSLLF